jgi:hypothetical protein
VLVPHGQWQRVTRRGTQNPKHNPNTTTKSVKDGSINPKATPQAQIGTGQKSKTASPTSAYLLTQKPQFFKPAIPGLNP